MQAQKHIHLEELLQKVQDLSDAVEERIQEGEDLATAQELLDELRDEISFRLE